MLITKSYCRPARDTESSSAAWPCRRGCARAPMWFCQERSKCRFERPMNEMGATVRPRASSTLCASASHRPARTERGSARQPPSPSGGAPSRFGPCQGTRQGRQRRHPPAPVSRTQRPLRARCHAAVPASVIDPSWAGQRCPTIPVGRLSPGTFAPAPASDLFHARHHSHLEPAPVPPGAQRPPTPAAGSLFGARAPGQAQAGASNRSADVAPRGVNPSVGPTTD